MVSERRAARHPFDRRISRPEAAFSRRDAPASGRQSRTWPMRLAMPLAGDVEGRAVDWLEHGREPALGVEVGGGRHPWRTGLAPPPDRTGCRRGGWWSLRVERFRVQGSSAWSWRRPALVPGRLRELGRHRGGDLVPHHHAPRLGIGLGDDGQQPGRGAVGRA